MSWFQKKTEPRRVMPSPRLEEAEFRQRYLQQFVDPAFDPLRADLERVVAVAWDAYQAGRKAPVTEKAGAGAADPDYDLSVDWTRARRSVEEAVSRFRNPDAPPRVLVVNGSSRSEHSCPGESSKSFRLAGIAEEALRSQGIAVDLLDLSRLASEYGRAIHPCKACFSTAAPLCHWPCSCYPNHSLGQVQDWMNDIYPLWAAAHGVMIITPVNWYQVTSPLKLMMDRLVCADGGNPDPSSTQGKDAAKAKSLELDGWPYPQHLAGRHFAVVAHGDVEGAEGVRRSVSDWLSSIGLVSAGAHAEVDRYIGYWQPYATSHQALDEDEPVQGEVRNAALALADAVLARRAGRLAEPGEALERPRRK